MRQVPAILLASGWAILLLTGAPALTCGEEPSSNIPREQLEFFESKVRPLLAEKCFRCHGPGKQKSHLRVDSRIALLTGGDGGPARRAVIRARRIC